MKNKLLTFMGLVFVLMPATSTADMIMILGDDNSETQVGSYLQTQGHNVHQAGAYYDWDGTDITVGVYDSIFLLYGYDYGYELTAAADQNLVDFVNAGGNVVTTEWMLYSIDRDYFTGSLSKLLPATYGGSYDYGPGWQVDESSPYMNGLTDGWSDGAGYSETNLVAGAVSVADDGLGNSLLSYITHTGGGTVFHFNHDLTYETDPISNEALTVLGNIAGGTSVPEPGALSILGLLGIGIATRRRRRKDWPLMFKDVNSSITHFPS